MNLVKASCAAMACFALVACQQQPGYNNGYGQQSGGIDKATVGTIGGAVVGGVLGSKIGKGTGNAVAIGAGTLIGAALGNSIGQSLDRADLMYQQQAASRALETHQPGQPLPWNNPQSGVSGTVVPQNYYQTADGSYCREYSQTINVGGRIEQGYGRACRQQDGTWRIVE